MRSNQENGRILSTSNQFSTRGSSLAELEALDVKGLLKANGIASILVGDPVVIILSRL